MNREKNTVISRILKNVVCLVLAFAFAVTVVNPLHVEAKTKKIALPTQEWSSDKAVADANCVVIDKPGTYNVKMKVTGKGWYQGYIKFVAPTTKEYKITVSNLKANDKKFANGITSTLVQNNTTYLGYTRIENKGTDKDGLRIASRKIYKTPTSRTGKIGLEAGQELYLYNSYLGSSKSKKMQFKLVIK
ncbi:hypothetical protein [Butyrivibrio sp. AC2005]|uniref:hypothetical protein n=1 Tax=Butyrivibrio sp. AC2005 TaxID=1280672 RepID=UPI0004015DF2|nr:hypothetical protein [Butyrivibrio sp. AC2005]